MRNIYLCRQEKRELLKKTQDVFLLSFLVRAIRRNGKEIYILLLVRILWTAYGGDSERFIKYFF